MSESRVVPVARFSHGHSAILFWSALRRFLFSILSVSVSFCLGSLLLLAFLGHFLPSLAYFPKREPRG